MAGTKELEELKHIGNKKCSEITYEEWKRYTELGWKILAEIKVNLTTNEPDLANPPCESDKGSKGRQAG